MLGDSYNNLQARKECREGIIKNKQEQGKSAATAIAIRFFFSEINLCN